MVIHTVILFHFKIDSAPLLDDSSHFSTQLAFLTLLLHVKDNSKCLSDQNLLVSSSLAILWAAHEKAISAYHYMQNS